MEITFYGASGGVPGSCFVIACCGKRILVDCGLFHGGAEACDENTEPFGFDPAAIDYVLLTHAPLTTAAAQFAAHACQSYCPDRGAT